MTDALTQQTRQVVASLDRGMPVVDVVALDRAIAGNMGFLMFRVGAVQAGALGALGLALAVVGVYGVVSYGAQQQARAIGIRVALGAEAHHIRRLVFGHGATLVAIGVGLGVIVALATTSTMRTVLVFVDSADPLTFAAVALLLAAVALTACDLPARRAMRREPMTVLRQD